MDSDSYEAVKNAITRRILAQRHDLSITYGLDAVMRAIDDTAQSFRGVQLEEIGSSDVSCWVMEVEDALARTASAKENGE